MIQGQCFPTVSPTGRVADAGVGSRASEGAGLRHLLVKYMQQAHSRFKGPCRDEHKSNVQHPRKTIPLLSNKQPLLSHTMVDQVNKAILPELWRLCSWKVSFKD
jgi:hypothetical protein